jgi:hypothetical protein
VPYLRESMFWFDCNLVTIEPLLKLAPTLPNRLSTRGLTVKILNRCTFRGHGRNNRWLTVTKPSEMLYFILLYYFLVVLKLLRTTSFKNIKTFIIRSRRA